ncbi:unnamed protein product [Paramecium sonneborni]|uniref:RING-type domain-containing protein n=1 Tax=Paramecium sonneborni TaxID=65129 RepID=A0A8S1N822_9CILI|nr:unnamed protein product [Paramecium sonneborni]
MQSKNEDHVKCKYCKQRINIKQMYAHTIECNASNHPNYQSQISSEVKQNQSNFQNSIIPKQSNTIQQSSQGQPVNYVESTIYNSQQNSRFNQNQSKIGFSQLQQNNTQEIQRNNQDNVNQYDESFVTEYKECEYCGELYPISILDQHYPLCETKKIIEQEQYQYQHEFDDEEQFNHHNHNIPQNFPQQSNQQYFQYQNYNEAYQNQQPRRQGTNVQTRIRQETLPDGAIRTIKTYRNNLTGEITEQTTVQSPQQQRMPGLFILNNQRNSLGNTILNNIFNNNPFFGNQQGRRFFQIPMMSIFGQQRQNNQELDNLAVIKFAPYEGLSQEYKQCSICLTNYEDGEELILLPCIHRFHKTCISEWFKEQTTCPICKTDVTQQEMPFEEDDLE